MFGRKSHPSQDSNEEIGSFIHLNEGDDSPSERIAKAKVKTEPSRGFFRKASQYDELKDDASDRSPSPTRSILSDSSRIDIPCLDRDSSSTAYTQRSAALSARRSQGIAESLRSRLIGKDDSLDASRPVEEPRRDLRSPSFNKQSKGTGTSKGKKRAISSSQSKSKAGYDVVSTSEDMDSPNATSTPPRSSSLENGVVGQEPYSKRSPGLMSSAARFAASFGQSSKSSSSDRLKQIEDSALETTSDPESPAQPFYSQFQPMSEAVGIITPPSKPSRLGVLSADSPSRPVFGGNASPGATRPLLDQSDASISPSPCPSPSIFPLERQLQNTPSNGFHTTTPHGTSSEGVIRTRQAPRSGRKTDPLPHRSLSYKESLGSQSSPRSVQPKPASVGKHQTEGSTLNGVRRLPEEALDIFEPRPDTVANGLEDKIPKHGSKRTMTQTIKHVENMTGHEALKALESGALLKKKWMGSVDTREAPAMTKTERLIRCRMQDGKVVVHYHHKGVKGFLDKDEVMTQVQRVEVVDGPWREGDCLLLHTGRGILALSAPDAATYTTWTLGLNAALTSSQQLAGDILLEAPVHAIPRDSMFVVKDSSVHGL